MKPARRQTLALQATLRLRRNGAQVRLVGASPSWSFSRCSALKQGPALGNLHMHVPTACRGAMQKQPRVVIIGGGAAGMACAWSLAKSSVAESVTVLEPSPHPGGVASTIDHEIGGCKLRINIGVQGALRRIPLEAFFAFVL